MVRSQPTQIKGKQRTLLQQDGSIWYPREQGSCPSLHLYRLPVHPRLPNLQGGVSERSFEDRIVGVPNLHTDVSECFLHKLAYGMHFSGCENEVLWFLLLEDPPHSLDVITS